jgi:2-polyprenyl-6-methoxyphenol hydroxylase-like FAD-dependent oxidoreductase
VKVADIRPDGLTVDGEEVRTRLLIGADGCNGASARALGLADGVMHGVALEANVPYEAVPRERYGGTMVLEMGVEPIMMIGVGLMVGVIIIAMYMPMFKMLTLVK